MFKVKLRLGAYSLTYKCFVIDHLNHAKDGMTSNRSYFQAYESS